MPHEVEVAMSTSTEPTKHMHATHALPWSSMIDTSIRIRDRFLKIGLQAPSCPRQRLTLANCRRCVIG
jgi:hypothetical protein